MNATLRQRGLQHRVSKGPGSRLSILWLGHGFVALLLLLFGHTTGVMLGFFLAPALVTCFFSLLALPIVAIFFFKSVKNGAIALLEQEGT